MKIEGTKLARGFLTIENLNGGDCFIFQDDCYWGKSTIYMALSDGYCNLQDGTVYYDDYAVNRPVEIVTGTFFLDD